VPFADPCRPPRVRTLDVLPLPAPIPLRERCHVLIDVNNYAKSEA
jgi:hypothetical protein